MSIKSDNIQLLKSANNHDRANGGGIPINEELTGDVSNELFPDITPVDRTAGRMFMRKAFPSVVTSNNDTLLGTHSIISVIPKDEKLAVFMKKAGFTERRNDGARRFEAYRLRSVRLLGRMYGQHQKGSTSLLMYTNLDVEIPKNNDVFLVTNHTGDEADQFVRVTNVDYSERTFNTTVSGLFQKRIIKLTLASPLKHDYAGNLISNNDSELDHSPIYETTVSNSAKVYGTKKLTQDVGSGSTDLEVGSPYIQAVPTSSSTTPVVGQTTYVNIASPSVEGTASVSFNTDYVHWSAGSVVRLPPFSPEEGSMTLVDGAGITLTNRGHDLVSSSGVVVGRVEPTTGIVTFTSQTIFSGYFTVTWTPSVYVNKTGSTFKHEVTSGNLSDTVTYQYPKAFTRGSVVVKYISNGEVYVLRDNMNYGLTGAGTGAIDMNADSVTVTFDSLPDIGSYILFSCADRVSELLLHESEGNAEIRIPFPTDVTSPPSGIEITWEDEDGTVRMADAVSNTHGTLTVDEYGILFIPKKLIPKGTTVGVSFNNAVSNTLTTHRRTLTTNSPEYDSATGKFTVVLGESSPHTVAVTLYHKVRSLYHFSSVTTRRAVYKDDGNGVLMTVEGNVVVGHVDYTTGTCVITPTTHYYACRAGLGYGVQSATITDPAKIYLLRVSAGDPTVTLPSQPNIIHTVTEYLLRPIKDMDVDGSICRNGLSFKFQGANINYNQLDSKLYAGEYLGVDEHQVGHTNDLTGSLVITEWTDWANNIIEDFIGVVVGTRSQIDSETSWFVKDAPIQNGSVSGSVVMADGTLAHFTSDSSNNITSSNSDITGEINAQQGFATITSGAESFFVDTLKYNAVINKPIPVDSDIIKMDTTRLPVDGRIPIYRAGDLVVILHQEEIEGTYSNGDVVTLRDETNYVRITDANKQDIDETKFTVDLSAHTITWDDVSAVAFPVTIVDRVENMRILARVRNDGRLTLRSPVDFDFPADETLVCNAIIHTDVFASHTTPFDQVTWDNVWSDSPTDALTLAEFNTAVDPIVLRNDSAITERWAIKMRSSTHFDLIGEHTGIVVSNASISASVAPINPFTDAPYLVIPANALTGFVGGNVIRFNTTAAKAPIWLFLSVSYGEPTSTDADANRFCIENRGAINV